MPESAAASSEFQGNRAPSRSDSARRIAQSSRASPGGKTARPRQLRTPFGIDKSRRLLGIGGAGQDHIGAVSAGIAMGTLIDRRRRCQAPPCRSHRPPADRQHRCRRRQRRARSPPYRDRPASAMRRRRARRRGRRGVQDRKTVPAFLHRAGGKRKPRRRAHDGRAARLRIGAGSDNDQRALCLAQNLGKIVLPSTSAASVSARRRVSGRDRCRSPFSPITAIGIIRDRQAWRMRALSTLASSADWRR